MIIVQTMKIMIFLGWMGVVLQVLLVVTATFQVLQQPLQVLVAISHIIQQIHPVQVLLD